MLIFLFSFSKWLHRFANFSFIFVFDLIWSETSYIKQERNYTLSPSRPQVHLLHLKRTRSSGALEKATVLLQFYSTFLYCFAITMVIFPFWGLNVHALFTLSVFIYTRFFFENRATKTCQSLELIVNLMPLLTGKIKSHLKKKLLNARASIW